MADEDGEVQDDELEAEGDGEGGGRRKLSGKALVLAGAALLVVLGGGGATYWLGVFGGDEGEMGAAVEEAKPSVFYDMPEMLVNLNTSDATRSRFLKLQVALEMTDTDLFDAIELQIPRIMDVFQIYLRELRLGDLEGSAGVYRLKEELLRRVNLILSPQRIDRVLFREILVQ